MTWVTRITQGSLSVVHSGADPWARQWVNKNPTGKTCALLFQFDVAAGVVLVPAAGESWRPLGMEAGYVLSSQKNELSQ